MLQKKMSNSWEKLQKRRRPVSHFSVSYFTLKYLFKDPPLGKPTKKFHPDDKKEGELLR